MLISYTHFWTAQMIFRRQSMKDDDCPGRPHTAVTDVSSGKAYDVIQKDRRLGVQAVAEAVHLESKNVWPFLTKQLKMKKSVQKWFQNCCWVNKQNDVRNCVWTFCNVLWMNHICWIRKYLWWKLNIYVWSGNKVTVSAVEDSRIKKITHELFEVQGYVDCFL